MGGKWEFQNILPERCHCFGATSNRRHSFHSICTQAYKHWQKTDTPLPIFLQIMPGIKGYMFLLQTLGNTQLASIPMVLHTKPPQAWTQCVSIPEYASCVCFHLSQLTTWRWRWEFIDSRADTCFRITTDLISLEIPWLASKINVSFRTKIEQRAKKELRDLKLGWKKKERTKEKKTWLRNGLP